MLHHTFEVLVHVLQRLLQVSVRQQVGRGAKKDGLFQVYDAEHVNPNERFVINVKSIDHPIVHEHGRQSFVPVRVEKHGQRTSVEQQNQSKDVAGSSDDVQVLGVEVAQLFHGQSNRLFVKGNVECGQKTHPTHCANSNGQSQTVRCRSDRQYAAVHQSYRQSNV